jgi:hypothetical protein
MLMDQRRKLVDRAGRTFLRVALLAVFPAASPPSLAAESPAKAKRIVENAIRAAGGQETLARYGAREWKEVSVFHGEDGDERYEASYAAQWPDKFKVDLGDFLMVIDGNKGWVRAGGETREMTSAELEEHTEGVHSVWVFSLLPLLTEEFTLTELPAGTAGGPTAGINVTHRGHRDIQLYFDGTSGLLSMARTHYKEARSGKEVVQETHFAEYAKVAGIETPKKVRIQRDGVLAVESTVEVRYIEKPNEGEFAKP